jgi:hypothetical protein
MKIFFSLLLFASCLYGSAQPITGVWRGKIINGSGMFATTGKVELKLIKKGDSLVGTCYYFNNANTYMRYSVKGYFDSVNNTVHWTDDKFLAVKPVGKTTVGVFRDPMVSEADFNCPGNNVMKLDGSSQIGKDGPEFTLHFDKVEKPIFHDEWDNVIEGYFTGMADPSIIDSVYAITKPFEPAVPDDVAKKVNPVIPGQQTIPGNASAVPSGTAQNSKTTGAGTIAGAGEKAVTATTAGIVSNAQPNKTTSETVISTGADAGIKPVITGESPTLAKEPVVVSSSKTPVLPGDSSGTIVAKTIPANAVIPSVTEPPKSTPGTSATLDTGKTGTTTVAVTNPPAAPATTPRTGITTPPATSVNDSKSGPAKTVAETKTPLPPASTFAGAGKGVVTAAAATKPLTGTGTSASAATSKPAVPGPTATNTPTPGTVAKQTVPGNTNAGAGKTVQPAATSTGVVNSPVNNTGRAPQPAVPVVKSGLPVVATASPAIIKSDPLAERMFVTRKKINQAEIPVIGDSIELNFYDNAEVDGDSISLFLNGKLLFNHVLLSAQAYTFKIPSADLPEGSELTMVAENLGTIPPNTAFMMAIVNGERYTAGIESTEQTSGVIKLVKRKQ